MQASLESLESLELAARATARPAGQGSGARGGPKHALRRRLRYNAEGGTRARTPPAPGWLLLCVAGVGGPSRLSPRRAHGAHPRTPQQRSHRSRSLIRRGQAEDSPLRGQLPAPRRRARRARSAAFRRRHLRSSGSPCSDRAPGTGAGPFPGASLFPGKPASGREKGAKLGSAGARQRHCPEHPAQRRGRPAGQGARTCVSGDRHPRGQRRRGGPPRFSEPPPRGRAVCRRAAPEPTFKGAEPRSR